MARIEVRKRKFGWQARGYAHVLLVNGQVSEGRYEITAWRPSRGRAVHVVRRRIERGERRWRKQQGREEYQWEPYDNG